MTHIEYLYKKNIHQNYIDTNIIIFFFKHSYFIIHNRKSIYIMLIKFLANKLAHKNGFEFKV